MAAVNPSSDLRVHVDARFISPYAMSAFVALTEKAVPFTLLTVDLESGDNRKAAYSALSLTQRVPALVDAGFNLSESSAIAEYLEERFPPPAHPRLYPAGLRERALARQVQAWIRSDLMPIREERSTEVVFGKPTGQPLSRAARGAASRLFAAADRLLASDARNLFAQWCIADTDLALMLNRLVLNGDEVPGKLEAYARHQWQRTSVQAWVKQTRSP